MTDTATLDFPPIDASALAPSAPTAAQAAAQQAPARTEVAAELVDAASVIDGKPLVTYSRTEAALADLAARYAGATFDLTTTAGDRAARAARLELKTLRTGLEKRRKELKAPALEFSAKIDAEAKRLTAQIQALEDPIDAQIVADEARREAERAERERIEAERRAAFEAQIAKIRGYAEAAKGSSSARITKFVEFVEGLSFGPEWADFASAAAAAQGETLATLGRMLADTQAAETAAAEAEARRVAQEAEAARLAAERAELERERAEITRQRAEIAAAQAAQREAKERAEREAQEAAAREAREITARLAAQDALAAMNAAREKVETEAREAAERQARAEEAEAARMSLEREAHAVMVAAGVVPHASEPEDAIEVRDIATLHEATETFGPTESENHAAARFFADMAPTPAPQVETAPAAADPLPAITVGDICARLGFTVTAAFLAGLGLHPLETTGRAVKFPGESWPAIQVALIAHIGGLQ